MRETREKGLKAEHGATNNERSHKAGTQHKRWRKVTGEDQGEQKKRGFGERDMVNHVKCHSHVEQNKDREVIKVFFRKEAAGDLTRTNSVGRWAGLLIGTDPGDGEVRKGNANYSFGMFSCKEEK